MISLEDIKQSAVWDKNCQLPLVPEHNNPWIYCAYIAVLLAETGTGVLDHHKIELYYNLCEKSSGLINRWPGGYGGKTSHDELIGASAIHLGAAQRIFGHITYNAGFYNNVDDSRKLSDNLYRFPWFIAYIKHLAGHKLSWWDQLCWSISTILDALFINKNDLGGKLKTWLMAYSMRRHWLCRISHNFWRNRMAANSITLQSMIEQELNYPELIELSKSLEL